MENFTPLTSTLGGILIGLSVAILFLFNGRILGISNIAAELLIPKNKDKAWRVVFLVGLLCGGAILMLFQPASITPSPAMTPSLIVAGLLVGFGVSLGRGCTSGHGICGISRLSPRSIVATLVFMASGMITVYVINHILSKGA